MDNLELPQSVIPITLDGRQIYLVGTAHVSKESVDDVRTTVEQVQPDAICVELCPARHQTLTQRDNWRKMDIFKILKKRKAVLLLVQLIMSSFYRRLGERLGVQPGAEMLEGIKLAKDTGATLVLADRNIEITFKRVWGYLGFWNKMKLLSQLIIGIFEKEEIDTDLVETLKERDQLESIMAEFAENFPEIKKRLIDERDIYLAQKIREAKGQKIVAVVGAGHCPGITQHIQTEQSLDELEQIPKNSHWVLLLKWGIPVLIITILIAGFLKGDPEEFKNSVFIWVGVNGLLSAIGAAAAAAHPITILAAFVAAPLTSLNPLVAAGWVAGIVQALIKRPTVDDFEDLPNAISTLHGFWSNPVIKVLLVVALANLGSVLGTYIAGFWIAARTAA
ncbi:TraB/GumN family protein [Planctomycetota bacterium]